MTGQGVGGEGASPAQPSAATELSTALKNIARASDGLQWEQARRSDMRLVEHLALEHVMTAGVPVGPGELSSRVGMSSGSGTELVDRLVRSGHLERHPHPKDRRRIVLRATEAAQERVRAERAPLVSAIAELAEGLTVVEVATITSYLARAVEVITAHTAASGRPTAAGLPTAPAPDSSPT